MNHQFRCRAICLLPVGTADRRGDLLYCGLWLWRRLGHLPDQCHSYRWEHCLQPAHQGQICYGRSQPYFSRLCQWKRDRCSIQHTAYQGLPRSSKYLIVWRIMPKSLCTGPHASPLACDRWRCASISPSHAWYYDCPAFLLPMQNDDVVSGLKMACIQLHFRLSGIG